MKLLYDIKVVSKLLSVVESLAGAPSPIALSAVAEKTGLPRPTAFRLLKSLQRLEYVRQAERGKGYALTSRFRVLFSNSSGDHRLLEVCRSEMSSLRDRFSETVNLAVAEGLEMKFVEVVESARELRMSAAVGHRASLFTTALGKSVLAARDLKTVEKLVISNPWERATRRTITRPRDFMEEIRRTARRGFAVDDREHSADCVCTAAHIPVAAEYAISISAPLSRVSPALLHKMGRALRASALSIARKLK